MPVYEPAEDSQLLAEAVKKHAYGTVLDMGTGSGILAMAAAQCRKVKSVVAADVDAEAVAIAREKSAPTTKKIRVIQSDLFANVRGKFDTIIFNPPYLPQDKGIEGRALYGGKKGYEVVVRFLGSCSSYLKSDGMVLLLFSSLTKKDAVDEAVSSNCLEKREIATKTLFMEMLHVYKITKSPLLKELEKKEVTPVKKFAQGNRGIVYVCEYRGKKTAVKAVNAKSMATGRIENEAGWLLKLNRRGLGPKLLFSGDDYFCYWFVEGAFIGDFLAAATGEKIIATLHDVLQQCRMLDKMHVDKEEMLRPWKHIIVGKKPVMIDFERCHTTKKPKNVTQFCQFLRSMRVQQLLREKGVTISVEALTAAAQHYKKQPTAASFKSILTIL